MQLLCNYWPIIANVLSCFDINYWLDSQSKTFMYPDVMFVKLGELRIFNCESVWQWKNFESFLCFLNVFLWRRKRNKRIQRKRCCGHFICSGAEFLKCEYTLKNCLGITICFGSNTKALRSWKIFLISSYHQRLPCNQFVLYIYLSPIVLSSIFVPAISCAMLQSQISLFFFFNKRAVLLLSFGLHCIKKKKINKIES